MIVIYSPGVDDEDKRRGHYFSCEHCGWCSEFFREEDSRLRAVVAAHQHAACKAREFVIPIVTALPMNRQLTHEERIARGLDAPDVLHCPSR